MLQEYEFGGAAAALQAAALLGRDIMAVVSRGGRPDMAGSHDLEQVVAPTLLLVGGRDNVVIELNREAYALLQCEKILSIVPGASHLFAEPGTLEEVARQATAWFNRYLRTRGRGDDSAAHTQPFKIPMTSSSST